jgi:hypothetical protein
VASFPENEIERSNKRSKWRINIRIRSSEINEAASAPRSLNLFERAKYPKPSARSENKESGGNFFLS